jgi:hypothetical protein
MSAVHFAQERILQAQGEWKQNKEDEIRQCEAEAPCNVQPFERNTLKEKAIGVVLKLLGNSQEPAPPIRNPVPLEILHVGTSVALPQADQVKSCAHTLAVS